jgi:hypothetical protein
MPAAYRCLFTGCGNDVLSYLTVLLFLARQGYVLSGIDENILKRLSFIILTLLLSACGSEQARSTEQRHGEKKRDNILLQRMYYMNDFVFACQ